MQRVRIPRALALHLGAGWNALLVSASCALCAWGAPRASRADPPPPGAAPPRSPSGRETYSQYEAETLSIVLDGSPAKIDPRPEGKRIEGVEIATLEVIEPRDPAPRFLNVFHATSRHHVIERELLLSTGDAYRQVFVDESVRNLRSLPQLSLVLAVPLVGSTPESVRLLVIAKDVWSLRLNSNWSFTRGGLESMLLQPTEANFLGTHQAAAGLFFLQPESYALGLAYTVPRISGSGVRLTASANVIVNRESGEPEGSYGSLLAVLPLYSARNEWAWDAAVAWRSEVTRRYVDARLGTFDAKATKENDRIPFAYETRTAAAQYSVTRSFGRSVKHDFSLGLSLSKRAYRTDDLAAYDARAVSEFVQQNVPVSDTRVGPFLQYHGYSSRFARLLDLETLGLQEDYRLGPEIYLRIYPVARALGSSRDLLGLLASAQYTVLLGDGIVRGVVESITEPEPDRLPDASIFLGLRVATPTLGFGRFVYDGRLLNRYRNYLNRTTFLGGDSRLRGYPTSFFVGKDWIASNLEFRTRPIQFLTVQWGAALFYDAGDAFNGWSSLHPKQSVGIGARILFPQLDRVVLRTDVGFPLGEGARIAGVSAFSFFLTFEQAFAFPLLTTAALPSGPLGRQ